MDAETDKLLHSTGSIKSMDTDKHSVASFSYDAPHILSPQSSFYKQFRTDKRMGDLFTKGSLRESPGKDTDQASIATAPKWSLQIDFDLWNASAQKSQESEGLKRFLLYSERTGIVKSSTFGNLKLSKDPGQLLEGVTFWLDVNLPSSNEMNLLGRVIFTN
jgi:Mg2+ and Co2+ transporter CorA